MSGNQPQSGEILIDKIKVGQRFRKDLGDIDALVTSIVNLGLLQPVVLDSNYRLIAGFRRLEAVKRLGQICIPCRIVPDLDNAIKALHAERDENECREALRPPEWKALGEALEATERCKATERKAGAIKNRDEKGRAVSTEAKFASVDETGKTTNKVAAAIGVSGETYRKARTVTAAAEADPEQYGDLAERMDETGKVDGAYKELKRRRQPKSEPNSVDPIADFLRGCQMFRQYVGSVQDNGGIGKFWDSTLKDEVAAELKRLQDDLAKLGVTLNEGE